MVVDLNVAHDFNKNILLFKDIQREFKYLDNNYTTDIGRKVACNATISHDKLGVFK